MSGVIEILVANALGAIVLAIVVSCVGRFVVQPRIRYLLWLVVLVKLVTPPIVPLTLELGTEESPGRTFVVDLGETPVIDPSGVVTNIEGSVPRPDRSAVVTVPAGAASLPKLSQLDPEPADGAGWGTILFTVWLAGVVAFASIASIRMIRFHRRVRSTVAAPEWLLARGQRLAEQFGWEKAPPVRTVRATIPPVVWAIGRPCVLIPERLIERLSTQEIDTLLAHEFAHIARRDHWMRWFELIVLTAYWWAFPVVSWIRSQFQEAEELCCDAWVLRRLPDRAQVYAKTLMETVDFLAETPWVSSPAASGFGTFKLLRRRFEMILENRFTRSLSVTTKVGLLLVGALALTLGPQMVRAETQAPDRIIIVRGDQRTEIVVTGKQSREVLEEIEALLGRTDEKSKSGSAMGLSFGGTKSSDLGTASGRSAFGHAKPRAPRASGARTPRFDRNQAEGRRAGAPESNELKQRLRDLHQQLERLERRLGEMDGFERSAPEAGQTPSRIRVRTARPAQGERPVDPAAPRSGSIFVAPNGQPIPVDPRLESSFRTDAFGRLDTRTRTRAAGQVVPGERAPEKGTPGQRGQGRRIFVDPVIIGDNLILDARLLGDDAAGAADKPPTAPVDDLDLRIERAVRRALEEYGLPPAKPRRAGRTRRASRASGAGATAVPPIRVEEAKGGVFGFEEKGEGRIYLVKPVPGDKKRTAVPGARRRTLLRSSPPTPAGSESRRPIGIEVVPDAPAAPLIEMRTLELEKRPSPTLLLEEVKAKEKKPAPKKAPATVSKKRIKLR